jgi:predicted nucleic acid-binding Zn ribbon protein
MAKSGPKDVKFQENCPTSEKLRKNCTKTLKKKAKIAKNAHFLMFLYFALVQRVRIKHYKTC